MIYCVIPEELADELFDKLTRYYADDPGVIVVVDRRVTTSQQDHGQAARGHLRVPPAAQESPQVAGRGRDGPAL